MSFPMTSPMSRPSTLLRAIPSNLGNRASAPVPPASQTYEPLIKSILRQRLTNRIFTLSVVCCWLETIFWTVWGIGGRDAVGLKSLLAVPFRPSTLVVAATTWLVVVVPIIVIRKINLSASRTIASSPAKTWDSAQSKNSTKYTLMTYSAAAVAATILHVLLAYINEPKYHGDPRLSLFVKSRRYPYYLNGRLLFLLLSQLTLAFGSLLRNVMLDRFALRWTLPPYRLNVFELIRIFIVVAVVSSASLFSASLSFAAIRMLFPILYKFPLLPLILRPFTGHFVRGSLTLMLPFSHIGLLFRAWFVGFTTMFVWEISELSFDVSIPQPIIVSHLVADSSVVLISGLSSSDRVMKFFALLELKDIASNDSPAASARRSDLFADQKYSPSQWSQLCRECLLLLGHDYQLFLRRGAPAPPVPASSPAPRPEPQLSTTPTPLLRKDIFRKEKNSSIRAVLDSFASDGPLAQAVDEGTESIHIPEIIKSVEGAVLPQLEKSKDEVVKSVSGATGIVAKLTGGIGDVVEGLVNRHAPALVRATLKHWKGWWREERLSKTVEGCIPFRELDVLAVEVLSHLVCASLSEDRYGVVQRDTPKIIEAMLSFLSAIEEYQIEINALYTAPSPDANLSTKELQDSEAKRLEVEKANDSLGLVGNALKEGVAQIARTFGAKLSAFKFPSQTTRKLQGFLDYC
ncbi:nucleoporin protein Ndc1-Nup [Lentinula aciculospora]|uniref:Nucleoporin protein Ndc1-Nup n=1 Tax=Lentinula aciculospora TaxID=153920 RepID=A0A9W9DSF4_9AGAR|nr:nucleoporin protein Ndc1-Nup [Lentinula aciculospora]